MKFNLSVQKGSIFTLFFIFSSFGISAQILKKIGQIAGDVASTGLKATTAPYQVIANAGNVLIGNGSVQDIYKPYQELGQSAGNSVSGSLNLINQPQQALYRKAQEFAFNYGGGAGDFIFDIGTFTNRFYTELGFATGQTAANILRGQNPLTLVSAPLAAAIRSAREKHIVNAQPLPNNIKQALSNYFDSNTLNRTRYTTGRVDITLPNFIGKGRKFMGDHYAVVVDDVIVFNVSPPEFEGNRFWWIHEIMHVQQYNQMGIETFAYNYIKDLGESIENEADKKASNFTGENYEKSNYFVTFNSVGQPINEIFITQCFFPQDLNPVNYLVSNIGNIYAVDPVSGNYLHIGYATPPQAQGIAWTYQTPYLNYAVTPQGAIMTQTPIYNNFGQIINYNWLQIGYVVRIQ
jgi:hypothetical protein